MNDKRIDFAEEIIKLEKATKIVRGQVDGFYSEVFKAAELIFKNEVIPAAKVYIASNKKDK